MRISLYALICAVLVACAPAWEWDQPVAEVDRACNAQADESIRLSRHVLVSDSEGNIPQDRHNGDSAEAFRTIMLGYAEAVRESRDRGTRLPRLLFYFNGGLNSQALVEEQAARQVPCMIADGYYPVFFVWDTDGLKSYWEQVSSVWDGQVDRSFSTRARTPLMVLGNAVSGVGQAPADYFIHGRRFTRAMFRQPVCSLIVRGYPDDLDAENDLWNFFDDQFNLNDPNVLEECPQEQRVDFVDQNRDGTTSNYQITPKYNVVAERDVDVRQREVAKFVYYSLFWPVRVVSTPFAHGLGEAAWTNMVRRTRTTINRSAEFNLNRNIDGSIDCADQFREEMEHYTKGTGIFARFFETTLYHYKGWELARLKWPCKVDEDGVEPLTPEEIRQQEHEYDQIQDALQDARIAVIGHSMGAIVINELLDLFPDLPYSDVVVMASAASLRDTRRVLNRYFEMKGSASGEEECSSEEDVGTCFYSLMLHPLNDARERQYYGAIPSGSLLMWIDEMYDVPKTPEGKVFGFWPTAKSARRMFGATAQDHMLYRVFSRQEAAQGAPANPVEHGDFNDDNTCFWRPSFWGVNGTNWQDRYEAALPEQALDPVCQRSMARDDPSAAAER